MWIIRLSFLSEAPSALVAPVGLLTVAGVSPRADHQVALLSEAFRALVTPVA